MRLLLDAHVLLWWLAGSRLLKKGVRDAIASPDADVFVSAATIWEIAIKRAAGRLRVPDEIVRVTIESFETLPVTAEHAWAAAALPAHHADPFDRMLVVQAAAERLTIVSADARLAAYGVAMLPA